MAKVIFNDWIRVAYQEYKKAGMTPEGAAGMLGNQYPESAGFLANRLEFLCVKQYKQKGKVYTDDSYTKSVDSGKISRAEFISPLGRHYGYGLSQWTTSDRKAGLYDLAKKKGVSIGDPAMQIEYTVSELKKKFPTTFKYLCSVTDTKKASDYVLEHYESPKNWQNLSTTRADYAKQIFDKMKSIGKDKIMGINNIIAKEREYGNIPYMETGKNHQKFSDIVNNVGLAGCQDQPWCATYQFAMEVEELGKAEALKHWNMTEKNYCGYSCFSTEAMFRAAGKLGSTPKIGALVIFRQSHMGRVLSINSKNKTFECGEGNTSNKKYERNGDSCAVKTYSWTDSKIKSFCYIDYGTEKETEPAQPTVKPVTKPDTPVKTLGNVGKGQKWLNTNYGSTLKKYMKELLDVDDSFGKKSRAAAVCVWKDLCNRKYKTKLDPSNSNFLSSCKKAAKKVVIKKGSSGTFVYLIEFILSAKGYYTGAMDASFGSGLQAAVKAFQKAVGLKADGIVGAETWYKLFN